MMGEGESAPGRLERMLLGIRDGAILRLIFLSVVGLVGFVLAQDFATIYRAEMDTARTRRTEPMVLPRPVPGDQIRPYLPRTMPVGPDRGEPSLPGFDGPVGGEAMNRPMAFRRPEGGEAISAVGRIEPGTAELLKAYLDTEGEGATRIVLHSPGGSVDDAIAMARQIREAGLETQVPADGYCASACPLMFAGGASRLAGDSAWVGVHQVYAVPVAGNPLTRDIDRSISQIQSTIADCQDLLVEMGIDPRAWILAMRTPPEELYVFTPEELVEFAFVEPAEDASPTG